MRDLPMGAISTDRIGKHDEPDGTGQGLSVTGSDTEDHALLTPEECIYV